LSRLLRPPLVFEDAHQDHVVIAALPPQYLATAALLYKAGLFIRAHSALVRVEHPQFDAVQIQLVKAEAQQHAHRVGAIALAPVRLLTDDDTQFCTAVLVVDVEQRTVPDQLIAFKRADTERVQLPPPCAPGKILIPVLRPLIRDRDRQPSEVWLDLVVTEPALIGRKVLAGDLGQANKLAFKQVHDDTSAAAGAGSGVAVRCSDASTRSSAMMLTSSMSADGSRVVSFCSHSCGATSRSGARRV